VANADCWRLLSATERIEIAPWLPISTAHQARPAKSKCFWHAHPVPHGVERVVKKRKQIGVPTASAPRGSRLARTHAAREGIVPWLATLTARTEIREKVVQAKQQRRLGKGSSMQPPSSDEMKCVTEIGGLRWKLGRTK
jgi:hypothetical protein